MYVEKKGYDEQFDPPAPETYECPLCLLVLRDPIQTECGHRFCRSCISNNIRKGGTCPIDNEVLNDNQIYPDNFARREILCMKVHCSNYTTHGCQWHDSLQNLSEHIRQCDFEKVPCPNKCNKTYQRRELVEHMANECVRRIIACQHCDNRVVYQKREDHYDRCPQQPMACPNNCGIPDLTRQQLNNHLESECQKRLFLCPYKDAGCEFGGSREDVDNHVNSPSNGHMQSMLKTIRLLGKKVEEQEEQIKKLTDERLELMDIDMQDPVNVHDMALNHQSSDVAGGTSSMNPMAMAKMKQLEIKVNQCITVSEMCRSELRQNKTELEGKFQELQNNFNDQKSVITDINARAWCGKFIWRIQNFEKMFEQARKGELPVIHSQPFYTGIPGYKMCLRVNLNGIDSGSGTHISLFVHLMQGEFDNIISWPFTDGLDLTIMDQETRGDPQHVKETLYARPTLQAFLRPKTPRNHKGYGYVEMIPHATLRQRGYIKNDTMVVRVDVRPR